jgi:protein-S-isoprenylcysteine O-methyltransferase Ste14
MTQKLLWTPLAVSWITFEAYWLISAARTKKSLRVNRSWTAVYALLVLIVLVAVILIARIYGVRSLRQFASVGIIDPVFSIAGLVLCALGLGFAAWARAYLGKNWGMPMSVRQDAELVMTGPYRFIRHPIYSGILLAMLGSALVAGILWLIVFVLFGTYFVLSARAEERLMTRQFPDQYPEYKSRTKALIPFIY